MLNSAPAMDPAAAAQLAAHWRTQLTDDAHQGQADSPGATPHSLPLPAAHAGGSALAVEALAALVTSSLQRGETLILLVPDDEWLPEISNALDLELRAFCLVLPEADFAAAITMRATLSLLKSRLTRPAAADCLSCWETQRQHLETHAELWQAALDWSTSGVLGSAWPAQISALFPVLILPLAQAKALLLERVNVSSDTKVAAQPQSQSQSQSPQSPLQRDGMLLIHAERMLADLPQLRRQARHLLLLHDPLLDSLRDSMRAVSGQLVRVDTRQRLQAELDLLLQELGDMELEFATAQAELAEFTQRYHQLVGRPLAELDQVQAQIAQQLAQQAPANEVVQQQARRAQAQAEQSRQEHARFAEAEQGQGSQAEKPFAPSRDLKKLFRQLAQKIHPDRAEDEADRAWRTELMSEANRAYRTGDAMVLQDILEQWLAGRDNASTTATSLSGSASDQAARRQTATGTTGPAGEPLTAALRREIQRVQRRIATISAQLNRLLASKLYELFAAANLARDQGRDLLQEMADQLALQLAAAHSRLTQLMRDAGAGAGTGTGARPVPPQTR